MRWTCRFCVGRRGGRIVFFVGACCGRMRRRMFGSRIVRFADVIVIVRMMTTLFCFSSIFLKLY